MDIEHLLKDCIIKSLDDKKLSFMELYSLVVEKMPGLKLPFFRTALTRLKNSSVVKYEKDSQKFYLN